MTLELIVTVIYRKCNLFNGWMGNWLSCALISKKNSLFIQFSIFNHNNLWNFQFVLEFQFSNVVNIWILLCFCVKIFLLKNLNFSWISGDLSYNKEKSKFGWRKDQIDDLIDRISFEYFSLDSSVPVYWFGYWLGLELAKFL